MGETDDAQSEAQPLRAVIFDYGHTFLDFAPAEEQLLACYAEIRRLLEAEAYHDLPAAPDLVRDVSGRVAQLVVESYRRRELEELDILALFRDALQGAGLTLPDALVQTVAEMEHRALASRLTVPPENLDVLRRLRERGLKIGLVSNAHFLPAMMREDIARLGIAPLLDASVFSAEIGVRKPHPAIFQKVLDELAVAPQHAVFVGDRLRDDIAGAKALGMRGILTRQYRQEELGSYPVTPDLIVDRLPDVVPWLLGLQDVRDQ